MAPAYGPPLRGQIHIPNPDLHSDSGCSTLDAGLLTTRRLENGALDAARRPEDEDVDVCYGTGGGKRRRHRATAHYVRYRITDARGDEQIADSDVVGRELAVAVR